MKGVKLKAGRFFDASAERDLSQEVVIDENAQSTLFGEAARIRSARRSSSARSLAW